MKMGYVYSVLEKDGEIGEWRRIVNAYIGCTAACMFQNGK